MASSDGPNPRRAFFRRALGSIFEAVDEVLEERGLKPREFVPPPPAPPRTRLRPPGALPEREFLDRCHRGGECVMACPVGAIQVHHSSDPDLDGTPSIVAAEGACVVCDDLACMSACPSGALQRLEPDQISMGSAILDESLCRRSFGEECTECVDRCPMGEKALKINDEGRVEVLLEGCIGCGVCEYYCPTHPRAIQIVPE